MTLTRGSTRAGLLATLAAFALQFSMISISTSSAQAAEPVDETRTTSGEVGAAAWTPTLSPFWPNGKNGGTREAVHRNLNTAERNIAINQCPAGYLCLAAGEGDGEHTVYMLWYCDQRALSNFIDAGAIVNNQTGPGDNPWAWVYYESGSPYTAYPANNVPYSIDWRPIWYVDQC